MRKGVTFKGLHSNSLGLRVRDVKRVMLPASRDEYTYISQRVGSVLDTDEPEDIYFEVTFNFMDDTLEGMRAVDEAVKQWLYSRDREQLIFDDEPNKYYLAKVSNQIDVGVTGILEEFTVMFRCYPYGIGQQKTVTANITTSGQSVTITNDGTAPTPPIIKITNTGTTTINNFTLEFTTVEG